MAFQNINPKLAMNFNPMQPNLINPMNPMGGLPLSN